MQETFYRYAVEQFAIVSMSDLSGNITFANDNFCQISKYSRQELIGKNHNIINSHHHPKEVFVDMWRTIAQGKVWRGEVKNMAKDQSYYWVDTTIIPILDARNRPESYFSIRIDITEKKNLELQVAEGMSKFKALVTAAPQPIVALDFDGIVKTWNKAAESTFGWSEEEIVGQPWPLLPEGKQAEFKNHLKILSDRKPLRAVETVRSRKDGSKVPVSISAAPVCIVPGVPKYIMGVITDITDIKSKEEKLKAQNTYLTELAFDNAHNLRKPVCSILGLAQLLNVDNPSHPDNIPVVEKIKDCTVELDHVTRQISRKLEVMEDKLSA